MVAAVRVTAGYPWYTLTATPMCTSHRSTLYMKTYVDIEESRGVNNSLSIFMPGKSGELGNPIPGKFCHLEGNFALQNTVIHKKFYEI